MSLELFLKVVAVAYLIGSIPTAYIVGRFKGINIFDIGSGNMGANNTARALGVQWGVIVWFADALKGLIAVGVARQISPSDHDAAAMIWGAVAAVLGHNWSVIATLLTGKIRGGKGAATASGTWVLLVPATLIGLGLMLWAIIVYLTRYVSLGVLTTVAVVSAGVMLWGVIEKNEPIYLAYVLVILMVFYRHRTNIRAIMDGTERRFGDPAKPVNK